MYRGKIIVQIFLYASLVFFFRHLSDCNCDIVLRWKKNSSKNLNENLAIFLYRKTK